MRFRAILGRSFEAVKQVSGTVIHFLVVGPSLLVLKSVLELAYLEIGVVSLPMNLGGCTLLLYDCMEVWRGLLLP